MTAPPPVIYTGEPYPDSLFEPIVKAYKKKAIGLYYERKNSGAGRSQSIGILPRRLRGVGESRNNENYAHILTEALKLKEIFCPEINYTTMMMNHNYQALTHVDKNNNGYSCVVAFGDYTGGELVIGDKEYDIRHKPLKFCAAQTPHSVKPITSGDRYSLVVFRLNFPKAFQAKYGNDLTYEQLFALIPERAAGQRRGEVRIPV